ncbi:hypothetical protein NF700_06195 [Sphingomonadaceae bacterium OTU29MARTA1]|nr:hypothetical protein NF699_07095 [Sphingomonadaceae bacterium OTU29LAMAA1]USU09854.1 hypothetical protein NF700_06195 [Sphingomonadaceae bacterium OTU29MARTA1]USU13318.1 hypothetical protein NF701_05655 [Sphingomonadaceae bacterium OTU29THOMA1]
MDQHHVSGKAERGDYIVRGPRPADAIGHTLRGIFRETTLPDDFTVLLHRLDRVVH